MFQNSRPITFLEKIALLFVKKQIGLHWDTVEFGGGTILTTYKVFRGTAYILNQEKLF